MGHEEKPTPKATIAQTMIPPIPSQDVSRYKAPRVPGPTEVWDDEGGGSLEPFFAWFLQEAPWWLVLLVVVVAGFGGAAIFGAWLTS